MEIAKSKFQYYPNLTSFRFILAIWVVLFHSYDEIIPFINFDSFLTFGQFAVTGFFMLSGIVLMLSFKAIPFSKYIKNRLVRIYPLYVFSLLFALPGFLYYQYKVNDNYFSFCTEIIGASVLMIQSWNVNWLLHINPPSWSLSVEIFLYLLFPLLVYILSRIKTISNKSIIALLSFLLIGSTLPSNGFLYVDNIVLPIYYIPTFLIGIVLGRLIINQEKLSLKFNSKLVAYLSLVSILIIAITLRFFFPFNDNAWLVVYSNFLFLPCFIILYQNPNILANERLSYLGKISYGIYLIHYPLKNYLFLIFEKMDFNVISIIYVIYIGLLIFFSHLLYKYLEEPVINKFKFKAIND